MVKKPFIGRRLHQLGAGLRDLVDAPLKSMARSRFLPAANPRALCKLPRAAAAPRPLPAAMPVMGTPSLYLNFIKLFILMLHLAAVRVAARSETRRSRKSDLSAAHARDEGRS
jgi:hypothetical protein